MTKSHDVKIPRGTTIDINGKAYLLKESIYAKSDGKNIILTHEQITTDLLTIERRNMKSILPEVNTDIPMPPVKTPRRDDIPDNLHETALDIVLCKDIKSNTDIKKNAEKYLNQLFIKGIIPEEVDLTAGPNVPKPKGPIPPASDD